MPAPPSATPLQAMLVSLSFGLCRQTRQNKSEAHKVEEDNSAARGTVRVSTFYFQRELQGGKIQDALSDLKKYFGEWRSAHNRLTRNWDGQNTRLLPAPLIQRYLDMKSHYEEGAPAILQAFLADYPDWYNTASERMGDLFDADDFPSFDQVRSDISWNTAILPLPAAEQWKRISLISPDIAATMEESTNQRIHQAVEDARKQTWQDLTKPIQNIVDVLSKDKPRIFDSLLGNLGEILELVPAFNLSNDPHLAQFTSEAKATLAGIKPDDLRNDPDLRKVTCQAAQVLLTRFGQASARKFAA